MTDFEYARRERCRAMVLSGASKMHLYLLNAPKSMDERKKIIDSLKVSILKWDEEYKTK